MKLIAFDLEGPLSPQDNAYDLMGLFPQGRKAFEIISRYDDLLTLEGKAGYEPGDTLALIAPFLVYHGIKESDITALAEKASFIPGAADLVPDLISAGWSVFCITTTYYQYSGNLIQRLGIPIENLAGTNFPLDQFARTAVETDFGLVARVEQELLKLSPSDDDKIKRLLDHFYWEQLPKTKLRPLISEVKPVGGRRKAEALQRFASRVGQPLSKWVAVGDSITDFRMFQTVESAGGLAIAFNANEYALPYATMGLATTDSRDLLPVLVRWATGGRLAVANFVAQEEQRGGKGDRNYFHWLSGNNRWTAALPVHRRIRRLVRESAANLG
ncbi:MAG: hypothetical protein AB1597_01760 [Chloroflexota bacterium]